MSASKLGWIWSEHGAKNGFDPAQFCDEAERRLPWQELGRKSSIFKRSLIEEHEELFRATGLALTRVIATPSAFSILEARPT